MIAKSTSNLERDPEHLDQLLAAIDLDLRARSLRAARLHLDGLCGRLEDSVRGDELILFPALETLPLPPALARTPALLRGEHERLWLLLGEVAADVDHGRSAMARATLDGLRSVLLFHHIKEGWLRTDPVVAGALAGR